uniref:Amine oxidase domain-containing protein n=1 Tax=Tetraselmis chuii TaxID=63592 RepID=A0A7S1X8U8_9CHLO|mmetsp:Transcript_3982/g.7295  ORF Transcript_3982/g.7295 Transcript_3982/m.7295 type:complete len:565 (+) Transcript_3982:149-1843(+)
MVSLSAACAVVLATVAVGVVPAQGDLSPSALRSTMASWPPPTPEMLSHISDCRQAVIGGGWSGVYAAYRLAAADPENAATVCLFEASHRLGGRTLSVPIDGTEFILDLGAYRFSPDMHLPGDIILKLLKIPTKCYEPTCPKASEEFPKPFMFNYTAPLEVIIDPDTQIPRGYGSALNKLAMEAQGLGVKIYSQTRLVDLVPSTSKNPASLTLTPVASTPATITPRVTVLNLPRQHMLSLPSLASTMPTRNQAILKCVAFEVPKRLGPIDTDSLKPTSALSKAYVYYTDAWWRTKLSLIEGQFPDNGFWPMNTTQGIRLLMHWNDGAMACSTDSDGVEACHGFLQVYYSVSNETFYSGVPKDLNTPDGVIRRSDSDSSSARMLDTLHAAILEALQPVLQSAGVSAQELPTPELLAVGVWRRPDEKHPLAQGYEYTAPTKVYWSSDISGSPAKACSLDGLTEAEYISTILQPYGKEQPIYLANNDYCIQDFKYMYGDWAEDSLTQAERAMHRLGLPRPDWLDEEYYAKKIESVESSLAKEMSGQQKSVLKVSALKRSTLVRAVTDA